MVFPSNLSVNSQPLFEGLGNLDVERTVLHKLSHKNTPMDVAHVAVCLPRHSLSSTMTCVVGVHQSQARSSDSG